MCIRDRSTACALIRAQLNMEGKRRKTAYMTLDDRLERTVKKYEESGDIVTCLKTISHLQKL